ncbi:MAG: hypothetical protein B7Z35_11415 [Hydrogenophilales bacterium 12-61-10]|nr:MAG: hypothetical protein B7Z35_11415 [Hydrogenophilales bacterium 12-61-10]OYX25953.1 MAG: hypothetical protein B7Z03_15150 [Hydrogenophilales bacterium 32-62-9]
MPGKKKCAYEPFSVTAKLPPLQGEGWGGDGVGMPIKLLSHVPHPPPSLPLEGGGAPSHLA